MQQEISSDNRRELAQAEILFRRREFATVVRNLAPQIFLHRGNRRYFYLLGIASLYIGDFSGAHSYLLRAKDLDPLNMDVQLGLAISYLWRKESPDALRIWVGIQDKHPNNRKASQGLETLKQAPDKIDWTDQLRLGRLRGLYPEPGFDWYGIFRKAAYVAGGLAILLAIFGVALGIKGIIDRRTPPERPGTDQVAELTGQTTGTGIQDSGKPDYAEFGILPGDSPRFLLSDGEIRANIGEIRNLFREYRDNKARVLLNKIMQSNASPETKEQLRGLSSHFKEPGFTNFRDNYEYSAVMADPRLFANVYVMWRGKIANLVKAETEMSFSFLLGYETSKIVTGTVPVTLGFAANLHNGDPIELIGQIRTLAASTKFSVQAVAIRLIKGTD